MTENWTELAAHVKSAVGALFIRAQLSGDADGARAGVARLAEVVEEARAQLVALDGFVALRKGCNAVAASRPQAQCGILSALPADLLLRKILPYLGPHHHRRALLRVDDDKRRAWLETAWAGVSALKCTAPFLAAACDTHLAHGISGRTTHSQPALERRLARALSGHLRAELDDAAEDGWNCGTETERVEAARAVAASLAQDASVRCEVSESTEEFSNEGTQRRVTTRVEIRGSSWLVFEAEVTRVTGNDEDWYGHQVEETIFDASFTDRACPWRDVGELSDFCLAAISRAVHVALWSWLAVSVPTCEFEIAQRVRDLIHPTAKLDI